MTLTAATARLRSFWERTRPVHPETAAVLDARWAELPETVRSSAQLLGRASPGCEGTHGMFPRCNLACTPCYHAKEAQQIRTDADHTMNELVSQMRFLRAARGPAQHAQLIGGEVTLLGPEDHAQALLLMAAHDRKPASMTHGDFEYDYLRQLAVGADGKRRFDFLRMAVHIDSLMLGRSRTPRPQTEADLHEERHRVVAMFRRLRGEHGVRFDLAHNMTVTPANLAQVAEVAREALQAGYGMASFQPAAHVGNPKRWREDYRPLSIDDVWAQLELGAGTRLPWRHLQMGDERCNRCAYGFLAAGRWHAFLDDRDARDLVVRDRFLAWFGGVNFDRPPLTLAVAIARVIARHPRVIPTAVGWALRLVRRVGLAPIITGRPRGFTFVVHAFMDADVVQPAWEQMQRGEIAADPQVRAAQERLQACSYSMGHPGRGETVPACVQHSVLDAGENAELLQILPMRPQR